LSNVISIVLYFADLANFAVGEVQKEAVGFAVASLSKISLNVDVAIVGNFDAYFLDYCGLLVWANVFVREREASTGAAGQKKRVRVRGRSLCVMLSYLDK
jgi:hypothetical protein